MAVELEQTIMSEIGLGSHYNYFNGSGSCGYIRDAAIRKLPGVAKKHGLSISSAWMQHLEEASQADAFDSNNYSLTNVWVGCSYAIEDAIYRSAGDKGFPPSVHEFHFFYSEKARAWKNRGSAYKMNRLDAFGKEWK
jgi:hypothetical protein